MLEAISLGFVTGVFLSLGFGSVFFALIQDSIDHGYKAGIKIALGVVFGDIILVALAIAGTSFLPNIPHFADYARLIGAVLLLGLAVSQFIKRPLPNKVQQYRLARFFFFFGKGFILNVINPVNFLSWVVASASLKSYRYDFGEEVAFFVTCIIMIFVCEALISFFAHKIKQRFSEKVMQNIKYVTGTVFFCIAVKLLYDVIS